MTFEELSKANAAISTMPIEKKDKKTGKTVTKDYAEVNQRIKVFRMLFPSGTISTELVSLNDGVAIFKASVQDEDGKLLGTGTAYEKEGSSFINQTSYIENCETSAVGRALAMCGIGIDLSIASYEEVANAKLNQEQPKSAPKVKGEIVKNLPMEEEQGPIPGYPSIEIMQGIVRKHYPEGSQNLKKLLETFKCDSIEVMSKEQLAAVYDKFGGR